MANVILRNKNGFTGTLTPSYEKYERPSEWLDLPSLSASDDKIVMLVKVYEQGNNWLGFSVQGDYQVDWGDGTVSGYTSGTICEYDIQWSGVSSSTLFNGYRQAIVTITPQSGSTITVFDGSVTFTSEPYYRPAVIDVKMATPNITDLRTAFQYYNSLEQFEFVGTPTSLTRTDNMFNSCYNLKKVVQFDLSYVTNTAYMFTNCYQLIEIPQMNIGAQSPTSVIVMFNQCWNIKYIPPVDCTNLTSVSNMFDTCKNLINNPLYNTQNISNFANLFKDCFSIRDITLDISSATSLSRTFQSVGSEQIILKNETPGQITNCSFLVYNANKLKYITPIDTSNSTNCSYMFYNTDIADVSWVNITSACTNLYYTFHSDAITKLPDTMDCTNVTNMGYTFYSCNARYLPNFVNDDLSNVTNSAAIFGYMRNIEVLPYVNVSGLTSLTSFLRDNYNLKSIPSLNLSNVTTSSSSTFINCYQLRWSDVYGLTKTHSYRYSQLDRDAIVNIFNNLGTAAGTQTIYVNNTPGAANLTAGDIAIATGKGWTVVS